MILCSVCYEAVAPEEQVVVPSGQAAKYVHQECLIRGLEQLDEDMLKFIQYLLEYEEQQNIDFLSWERGEHKKFGWQAMEVARAPAKLKLLLNSSIIGISFKSNTSTYYALAGKEILKSWLMRPPTPTKEGERVPKDLFSCIIGYDDIKNEMLHTLTEGIVSHYLLIGPPATSKSLFLMEVGRLPEAYLATGSSVRGPGLTDALKTYRPTVLSLDEADKIPMDALAVLLSVMETGDVLETKFRRHSKASLNLSVFAAANTVDRMPPEFLSRFEGNLFYFHPYAEEEFIRVCQGYLVTREGLQPELSRYVGKVVYNELDNDIRTARGIAKRLRESSMKEVDRVVLLMKKYQRR